MHENEWHGACLLFTLIWEPIGQYLGVSNNYSPIIHNSHSCFLEVSLLKIIILWRYGIPATTHYKQRKLQTRFHYYQASRRPSMTIDSPPLLKFPWTRVQGPFFTQTRGCLECSVKMWKRQNFTHFKKMHTQSFTIPQFLKKGLTHKKQSPVEFPPLESAPVSLASLARKRARCDSWRLHWGLLL